ncbi:hypothetical protein OO013_13080 [Mangrovivirga sp. M17]|uniref:Uncharacterized protein n=1 Tax=Mangrovivirga halotolerans TaxID=2993936 RepID=A0ABT3RT56_9BACT|nr:hypothetical protein [Mangrovivirga halotolerans]MCX2744810.1 hypothetical protein [Mangrovivirga halotolerans]
MRISYLSLLIYTILSAPVCAQYSFNQANITRIQKETNSLPFPDDLRSEQLIVLIDDRNSDESWFKIAAQFHKPLKEAGVDLSAYYRFSTVLGTKDFFKNFKKYYELREIGYIAWIYFDKNLWNFRLIPLDKLLFGNLPLKTYTETDPSIKGLSSKLARKVIRQDEKRKNLLIPDEPLFYNYTNPFEAKRFDNYNINLQSFKLAVPKFHYISEDPEEQNAIERANEELEQIMELYPFEYELTEPGTEEDVLARKGFKFILIPSYGSEHDLKKILGYKYENIPDNVMFKYYIRQLSDGDIHLGPEWDGAETWQQALKNHLKGITNQ